LIPATLVQQICTITKRYSLTLTGWGTNQLTSPKGTLRHGLVGVRSNLYHQNIGRFLYLVRQDDKFDQKKLAYVCYEDSMRNFTQKEKFKSECSEFRNKSVEGND